MVFKKTLLPLIVICGWIAGYVLYQRIGIDKPPTDLYKIVSVENWEQSKNQNKIVLSKMDDEFIHLATKEQLDKIIKKFWKGIATFVLLTVNSKKLPGKLKFESNPGGTNKYYHLYDGSIPNKSITKTKIVMQ